MAVSFKQIIAGDPPTGGDTGAEFAQKINDNFNSTSDSLETVEFGIEGFSNRETVFYENGAIEEFLDNDTSRLTIFNENGSISEILSENGVSLVEKLTIFNENGSIKEELV